MILTGLRIKLLTAMVAVAWGGTALAQNAAGVVQRDANQQERIEQGLKSGQLNTKEAARLEREQSRIDKLQSKALEDGKLSEAEKQRIERAQNKASKNINQQKHDAQTGNPDSASSQRLQADVQRNANQQERIEQGLKSGSLTKEEAAKLERGQAAVSRKQANSAADGHVGPREQKSIDAAQDRQSKRIYRKKHNAQER